jgi:hypothetical protein
MVRTQWRRIHYEQEGSGESVLVLPGWAGSIDEFVPIRTALSAHFVSSPPIFPVRSPGPATRLHAYLLPDDAETF